MAKKRKDSSRRRQHKSRWPSRLLLVLIGVGVIVWCAPWIIARTSLRDRLLPLAVPEFEGRATIGDASFDWLSPVEMRDLRVVDHDGQPLLDCVHVRSDRTLSEIVFQGVGGTQFQFDQPHVHCRIRPGGSNIEDALQPLLTEQESIGAPLAFTVKLNDGTIELGDQQGALRAIVSGINVTCAQQPGADPPLTVEATGVLSNADNSAPGKFAIDLRFAADEAAAPNPRAGRARVTADQLAIETLEIMLQRFHAAANTAGLVTADLQVEWDVRQAEPELQVVGQLDGKDWSVQGLEFLGQDRFWLAGLQSKLKCSLSGKRLDIQQCNIDSDLAQLDVVGTIHTDGLQGKDLTALFGQDDYRARGRISLAKLADRIPGLLNLRDGMRITDGEMTLELDSTVEDQARRWRGKVTTSHLEGTAAGRPISWKRPIEIDLNARQQPDGGVAGRLTCQSEFLEVAADGSVENATISVRADLDRLAADLRQFVDLGDLRFAGSFEAGVQLAREKDGRFDANGHALLQQFEFSVPGMRPWREPRMTIVMDAAGTTTGTQVASLDRGTLRVVSAGDRLDARLRQPVSDPQATSTWPVELELDGRLATWLPRVQTWLPLTDWQLDGDIELTATADVAPERTVIDQSKIQLVQLRGHGSGVVIDEPRVDIETSASWDSASGRVASPRTTIASQTASVRAEKIVIALPQPGGTPSLRISGDVGFDGDMARLHSCFAGPPTQAGQHIDGRLEGQLRFANADGVTQGDWSAKIHDLVVSQPADGTGRSALTGTGPQPPALKPVGRTSSWQPVWTEKVMTISGNVTYQQDRDQLQLRNVAVQSGVLQLQETGGTIENLTTQPTAAVTGEVRYDLSTLTALLQPYVGQELRMTGRGARGFRYEGPLSAQVADAQGRTLPWWTGATAEAAVGWDGIELYGLIGGRGELHAALVDGLVRFDPLEVAFSEGSVRTTPEIRFNQDPAVMVFSRGPTIDRARLSAQLCRSWLQYVTPVLAGSTEAEGQFSVALERATVPLAMPKQSDVAGTLTIHEAQIRAAPLAQQLISVARQVDALIKRQPAGALAANSTRLNIKPHDVTFAVSNGRVHHRGFQLEVGDVLVRTSGSVGMDNSLTMTAEIPIRDSWVERDRYLQGLRGKSVQIPVSGTIDRPQLDKRALSKIARQMATSAAGGLIDDALNKGLNDGLQKGLEGLFKRGQ